MFEGLTKLEIYNFSLITPQEFKKKFLSFVVIVRSPHFLLLQKIFTKFNLIVLFHLCYISIIYQHKKRSYCQTSELENLVSYWVFDLYRFLLFLPNSTAFWLDIVPIVLSLISLTFFLLCFI